MDITLALHKKLEALANLDSQGKRGHPRFSVYVIEVEKVDPNLQCDFYVGSTVHPVWQRLQQHIEGHKLASRPFKYGRGKAKCVRWDLMENYPKYFSRANAEEAERLVAIALQSAGWVVHCNMLNYTVSD